MPGQWPGIYHFPAVAATSKFYAMFKIVEMLRYERFCGFQA